MHVASFVLMPRSQGVSRISGVRIQIATGLTENLPCPAGASGAVSPVSGIGVDGSGLCFILAGNSPILVGTQAMRAVKYSPMTDPQTVHQERHLPAFLQHHLLFAGRNAKRSLLQQGGDGSGGSQANTMPTQGDVYGDANLDGKFTLLDYLFAQEYYNGATSIGCQDQGGTGCQARSGLITWQVRAHLWSC